MCGEAVVNESRETSGNSQVDRVLSLFRESTVSVSIGLLIVAGRLNLPDASGYLGGARGRIRFYVLAGSDRRCVVIEHDQTCPTKIKARIVHRKDKSVTAATKRPWSTYHRYSEPFLPWS